MSLKVTLTGPVDVTRREKPQCAGDHLYLLRGFSSFLSVLLSYSLSHVKLASRTLPARTDLENVL